MTEPPAIPLAPAALALDPPPLVRMRPAIAAPRLVLLLPEGARPQDLYRQAVETRAAHRRALWARAPRRRQGGRKR